MPHFATTILERVLKDHRLAIILILVLLSFLSSIVLYRTTPYRLHSMSGSPPQQPLQSPRIPRTVLSPSERSLGYLPYAGLTNQFIAFQHAAWLALHLNRTLILPPITSNKHDRQRTFQKWSNYFDIPRFEQQMGMRVKEWPDVKVLTEEEINIGIEGTRHSEPPLEWDSLAENITCQVTRGFDVLEGVPKLFSQLFLLRVSYVEPPPSASFQQRVENNTTAAMNSSTAPELSLLSDLRDRYQSSEEGILYFSHTYSLKGSNMIRPFDEIGQHIHFRSEIADLARQLVQSFQESSSTSSSSSSPPSANAERPYIAIHLRRDDIIFNCVNKKSGVAFRPIEDCTPSIQQYAAAVDKARERLKLRTSLEPFVVVMSDTTSKQDIDAIHEMGWHRVDHGRAGTEKRLGVFGAAMVDAAILAHADELVGSHMSTMSFIAQVRQKSWFGRNTFYP
ncbi:hypothetical protein EC968_006804 [Mortierella alpina]|nr:hypothetical protein EC968_006804 [Mortierella alpina]